MKKLQLEITSPQSNEAGGGPGKYSSAGVGATALPARQFDNPIKGLAIDVEGLSQQDSQYYNETESEGQNRPGDLESSANFSQGYRRGSGKQGAKPALALEDSGYSMGLTAMSCELGSQGLKVARENFEIGKLGMTNLKTGEVIVGNLTEEDLEYGEILGNGASGYVYAAIHRPTGRKVALKSINVFDKGKRHQLVNDLRSLSRHTCPFLIQFYGAMFDEGAVKVALELMDIGSLKDVVKLAKGDPTWVENSKMPLLPEEVASKVVQMILAGLSYLAICKKQMHRDIKLDNILVNTQGFVKLTDFGITKQLDETIGLAGTFVGTMNYMSPERMEGEKYSFEGDIWSLGIVLVELMTGAYPYVSTTNFLEMLEQIKYEDSPNVPDNGLFSDDLTNFIGICLQKEPSDRQSAVKLMAHPWILKYSQSQANLPGYLARLQSYRTKKTQSDEIQYEDF